MEAILPFIISLIFEGLALTWFATPKTLTELFSQNLKFISFRRNPEN